MVAKGIHQHIKTFLIKRACKLVISSSDDSILYDPLEERDLPNKVEAEVQHEIKQNANSQPLDFEEAQVVDEVVDVSNSEVVEETTTEMQFPTEAPFA